MKSLRIANDVASALALLQVDLARARVAIGALLAGRVEICSAVAERIDLNLAILKDGRPNWLLGPLQAESEPVADIPGEFQWQFAGLGGLSVRQATLSYRNRVTGRGARSTDDAHRD